MYVFISWSGLQSRQIALALRDWLPGVINAAEPYVSSEDIEKGARWSADIAGKLNSTSIGIICVTRENMNRPWINFEAGALSKAMGTESRVIPLLVDLGNADLVGPLNQFQTVLLTQEDMRKLVDTINNSADKPNPSGVMDKVFRALWSDLEGQFKKILSDAEQPPWEDPPRSDREMLQELVELSRDIQRSLVKGSTKREPNSMEKRDAHSIRLIERAVMNVVQSILSDYPEVVSDLEWMLQIEEDRVQVLILEDTTELIEFIASKIREKLKIWALNVNVEIVGKLRIA